MWGVVDGHHRAAMVGEDPPISGVLWWGFAAFKILHYLQKHCSNPQFLAYRGVALSARPCRLTFSAGSNEPRF